MKFYSNGLHIIISYSYEILANIATGSILKFAVAFISNTLGCRNFTGEIFSSMVLSNEKLIQQKFLRYE